MCYNLDVIISVDYRVNSLRGVQFRIWATRVLREYAELQAQSHIPMYMKDWILSPIEIHFLENFEREHRKLGQTKP